jgi:hypothetical protein
VLPEYLLLGFVFAATLIAFRKWRIGIFLAILAGMIQDPVRKMTPGAPPFLVLSSVPIWLAIYVSVIRGEVAARLALRRAYPRLSAAATLFAASLLVPALLSFQYGFEGWQLAVLGLFGYLSPLLGVLVGFAFARRVADIRRLLTFYSIVSGVMLVGTVFEYLHFYPDWAAIGTDALGAQWVRYTGGGVVDLQSGFFRSPDVMGWHAAALVMLSLALVVQRRVISDRLWLLVAAWGGVCLLLAGRRKMMMMPIVWAACLVVALVGTGRFKRAAALTLMGIAVVFSVYYASGEFDVHESYYVYAGTVAEEGPMRVMDGAWGSVWETYRQAGFLGMGLGAASQGAHYLAVSGAESWQESGSSKVMAELGVPGFFCALVLVWRIATALRSTVRAGVARGGGGVFSLPLVGFVVANAACFTVSHQVYSDAVVLTMTSVLLGTVLAAHRWAAVAQAHPESGPPNPWVRRATPMPVQRAG